MNKTNGFREQASASTSLDNKEQIKSHSNLRPTTSGLSFFKWFKKNDKTPNDSRASTKSIGRNFHFKSNYVAHHSISPSSSPNLEHLSPSSSCDSIKSTSTTGFAFIKPNNYRPSNGVINNRTISSQELDISDHTSNKLKPDLTLRRKYCLYDADTLTSTEGDYDNVRFGDRSLPHLRKKWRENLITTHQRRKTRRTVSDSSKDKKSGAYVHVKGKRKAPPPPSPPLVNGNSSTQTASRSTATLNRKKRKAPPPPNSTKSRTGSNLSIPPDYSDEHMNDMDIKALIRSSTPNTRVNETLDLPMARSSAPPLSLDREDFSAAQKLTEEQKQVVLDNIVRATHSASSSESEIKTTPPPASPISPRPWYKRSISSNRDSAVPFKREIVLKTMEKRKVKQKEKTAKADNAPEAGHYRSSLFEASSKFGFFLRGKDHSDKDKEKRRSGIGIPNISELDREAAEIVHREYAQAQAFEKSETEKFFAKSDHIMLQQEMFGSKNNIKLSEEECQEDGEAGEVIRSAKDLISKFEASSNGPRITLNTSFIGRKDNFVKQVSENRDSNLAIGSNAENMNRDPPSLRLQQFADHSEKELENKAAEDLTQMKSEKTAQFQRFSSNGGAIDKPSWTCSFCTLENPGSRIICEVCERIKPYGKQANIQNKIVTSTKPNSNVSAKQENTALNVKPPNQDINSNESPDWDKKTEKVLKYFMPKTRNSSPLMKSSSETSVGHQQNNQFLRRSPSPGKPVSGSPQFGLRYRSGRTNNSENIKPTGFTSGFQSAGTIFEEKENLTPLDEPHNQLLDASVIVTTITPVFWAHEQITNRALAATTDKTITETETNKVETAKDIPKPVSDETPTNNAQEVRKTDVKPESIILNPNVKIDIKEVRKARLAKFAIPELIANAMDSSAYDYPDKDVNVVRTDPQPIYDHETLEREKKRLRDMIQAMNAKALAEKYPTANKKASPPIEELKSRTPPKQTQEDQPPILNAEQKTSPVNEQAKLGAIKKVFVKTRTFDLPKKSPDPTELAKPKKVSSSAQTTVVPKKSLTPDDVARIGSNTKPENIYANVPIYENSPLERYDRNIKLSENERVKVQEISQQLTSFQGINDFKESLKHTPRGISATDTIALSKIMRNLETAIAEGQHELAAQIAIDLARMKVSLHVTKQKDRPISRTQVDFEKNIIVDMFVEDKHSQKGPIQIAITPLFTITQLKQKIATDFNIPIGVQRWLINDDLALDDEKILLEFGVKDHTATLYLYIIAPEINFYEVKKTNVDSKSLLPKIVQTKVKASQEIPIVQHAEVVGASSLPQTNVKNPNWACSLCTLINPPEKNVCLACTKPKPKEMQLVETPRNPMVQVKPIEKRNDLNKSNPNRRSTDGFNIVDLKIDVKQTIKTHINPSPNANASPNITRTKYRGVDNFNPNRKKGQAPKPGAPRNKTGEKQAPIGSQKDKQPKDHYLELLNLDNADIVPNLETFECPVCFMKFDTAEGVILRDCLHTFCKECLGHTIQYSEDAEVKCPYMDAEYSCDSVLQEREVRALVSKDIYELHLVKSMRVAEHQIENAFHCKTPNCRGWCIYEDNVNVFKCPVCKITNCLTCRVIHDGLTCKQYQDRLNSDCDSNLDAKQTKQMLEEMLKNGEAMNCPTCQVVMMKKWGCDWLKCSMCKTEVCWVTRGPRWGPGGKGDTSAGCRCGVNSVKCHPKCNYCH